MSWIDAEEEKVVQDRMTNRGLIMHDRVETTWCMSNGNRDASNARHGAPAAH